MRTVVNVAAAVHPRTSGSPKPMDDRNSARSPPMGRSSHDMDTLRGPRCGPLLNRSRTETAATHQCPITAIKSVTSRIPASDDKTRIHPRGKERFSVGIHVRQSRRRNVGNSKRQWNSHYLSQAQFENSRTVSRPLSSLRQIQRPEGFFHRSSGVRSSCFRFQG